MIDNLNPDWLFMKYMFFEVWKAFNTELDFMGLEVSPLDFLLMTAILGFMGDWFTTIVTRGKGND